MYRGVPSCAVARTVATGARESPTSTKPLLQVQDVRDRLRVSRNTVYRLMNSGELRYVLVGEVRRVREEDLQDYITRVTTPRWPVT